MHVHILPQRRKPAARVVYDNYDAERDNDHAGLQSDDDYHA